jgi:uncharacterized protein (UPF0371 family)
VENFPILRSIIERIVGSGGRIPHYQSPTDMGVNCAFTGIVDDDAVREAARQEIIRRYFRYNWEYTIGVEKKETVERAKALLKQIEVKLEDRKAVLPAREAAEKAEANGKGHQGNFCGSAIELESGELITGKNSPLMHSASAAVLNAVKTLAGIPDKIDLLPAAVIHNLTQLKKEVLGMEAESLDVSETLIALAISSASNPSAQAGMDSLKKLKGCEMHMTHIPTQGDQVGLRRLGLNITTDAVLTPGGYFLR